MIEDKDPIRQILEEEEAQMQAFAAEIEENEKALAVVKAQFAEGMKSLKRRMEEFETGRV